MRKYLTKKYRCPIFQGAKTAYKAPKPPFCGQNKRLWMHTALQSLPLFFAVLRHQNITRAFPTAVLRSINSLTIRKQPLYAMQNAIL